MSLGADGQGKVESRSCVPIQAVELRPEILLGGQLWVAVAVPWSVGSWFALGTAPNKGLFELRPLEGKLPRPDGLGMFV